MGIWYVCRPEAVCIEYAHFFVLSLQEAEDAEKSLKTSDDSLPRHTSGSKKAAIAAKMKVSRIASEYAKH